MTDRTLGQVIAVERTLRKEDNDKGAAILNGLTESRTLGEVKEFFWDQETPSPEDIAKMTAFTTPQHKKVQARVEEGLQEMRRHSVAAMNVVATKDRTNTIAAADVMIGDTLLLAKVPVSHLLWLEGYITEWRASLAKLPTLSPLHTWNFDDGLFKADGGEIPRTSKEIVPLVLHPGTDKHPPQATTVTRDLRVGRVVSTLHSGAIRNTRKRELLDRCDVMLVAIKDAIARANRTIAVEVRDEGDAVLDFILGEQGK